VCLASFQIVDRIRRQSSWASCKFVYTPPTPTWQTVLSRRHRRCVLGIRNSKSGWSPIWGELVLGSQTIYLMRLMASTMLSAATETIQFSASFIASLFHGLWQNCGMAINFVFLVHLPLIKIVNTLFRRSAVLILSVVNWTYPSYSSCTGIRLEIWLEPNLVTFPICRSWRQTVQPCSQNSSLSSYYQKLLGIEHRNKLSKSLKCLAY